MSTEDTSTATEPEEILRVDSRGRVNVARYVPPGTNLIVTRSGDDAIILERAVVMTAREFEELGRRNDTPAGDHTTTVSP